MLVFPTVLQKIQFRVLTSEYNPKKVFLIYIFSIVTGNTFHIYIYKFQILLTNYKHTQTTIGLSGSMSSITVLKAEILVKC